LGFIGSAAAYFWPTQRSLPSGGSVSGSIDKATPPQLPAPPHIRVELTINSTSGDDVVFDLNLTNIGGQPVSELRIGMKSAQVFDYEPNPGVPRQIPPGGTMSARGIMANGLAKSRELSVFLTYKTDRGTFSSSYKFDFKGVLLRGNDTFNPAEWQESTGDILAAESKGLAESTFAGPVGMMFFRFPEIRPDTQSQNNISLFTDGKKLLVDIENRLVSFWVRSPSGKEWTVDLKIKPQPHHNLVVSWDEGGIALSLDGALATAGKDAQAALPIPPIGTLQYVTAALEVERRIGTKDTAAQIVVTLRNTNPFLMRFQAKMIGDVNGMTSPRGEITFDGSAYANSDVMIRYDRLSSIKMPDENDITTPALLGTARYQIMYWAAENEVVKRVSGKTLRIEIWPSPFTNKPGKHMEPAKVSFEDEVEQ
jgi:hypothetical protein